MQKALNTLGGTARFEVVNAPGPSYNTVQQLLSMRQRFRTIDADLLIPAFNSEYDIHYTVEALRIS